MIHRLRWFDVTLDLNLVRVLSRAIMRDLGDSKSRSGFRLFVRRPDFLEGMFFEKFDEPLITKGPDGLEYASTVSGFNSVEFVISTTWPSLEIRNWTGELSPFLRKIQEYIGCETAVSKLDSNLGSWLNSIESNLHSLAILSIDAVSTSFSSHAVGSIRLQGKTDIRNAFTKFAGDRSFELRSALLDCRPVAGRRFTCELKKNAVVRFESGYSEYAIGVIRDSLRVTQGRGVHLLHLPS